MTLDCGNFAARLYSAPMGAKRVARDPENEEPDISKPKPLSRKVLRRADQTHSVPSPGTLSSPSTSSLRLVLLPRTSARWISVRSRSTYAFVAMSGFERDTY